MEVIKDFDVLRLKGLFFLHFAKGIETKYQQLYLSCLDNNWFESGYKRVFEPSGLA